MKNSAAVGKHRLSLSRKNRLDTSFRETRTLHKQRVLDIGVPKFSGLRLHKPVTDWLETLPHSVYGVNM